MDFNLNQWRNNDSDHQQQQQQISSSKLPKFLLNSHTPSSSAEELPLFTVPESTSNLSAAFSSDSTSATKFHRMGSYFSSSQWQELELQALIFRHMMAGAAVPNELLHLVKKSLITSPYYLSHSLHQFYPHYQSPNLAQSGYWGKAAMDPEPGRCRRTDGKKWRCSRDIVAGQKYCERHMHRGKNRSRKPVEIPTPATCPYAGNRGGGALKTNNSVTTQGVAGGHGGRGGDTPHFTLSRPSHSTDLLQPNQRPSGFIIEAKDPFEDKGEPNGRTLQPFFDDWPRTLHKTENSANSTNLSISMPNNSASDFSLTLGTGNDDEPITEIAGREKGKSQSNWGMATWETTRVGPMGGPLAEALRSSMSNSSPTSVLHRLARANAVLEASYDNT